MIARLMIVAIAAAAIAATPASAADSRQPTGKWVAEFAEAQCVAMRSYGTKEQPLYLVLKAPPLGSVVQIMVVRKGAKLPPEQMSARVAMGSQLIRTTLLAFRGDKADYRTYLINLPVEEFAAVRDSPTLSVTTSGLNETFALTDMAPLMKVMDECVADLRTYWNIAQADLTASDDEVRPPNPLLRAPAEASISELFSSRDYPWPAIVGTEQGSTTLMALIDQSGRVADCSIVVTSGVAALDSQSCAIVKERARFKPAIGLDGKPARDAIIQRIHWRIR